jgi:hypothetical protein
MNSAEKENAGFESPVPVKGNVENWLSAVEAMMKKSIKMIARQVRESRVCVYMCVCVCVCVCLFVCLAVRRGSNHEEVDQNDC